jgi:hypothetical protein
MNVFYGNRMPLDLLSSFSSSKDGRRRRKRKKIEAALGRRHAISYIKNHVRPKGGRSRRLGLEGQARRERQKSDPFSSWRLERASRDAMANINEEIEQNYERKPRSRSEAYGPASGCREFSFFISFVLLFLLFASVSRRPGVFLFFRFLAREGKARKQ